mgnify:CR=1 FL=1
MTPTAIAEALNTCLALVVPWRIDPTQVQPEDGGWRATSPGEDQPGAQVHWELLVSRGGQAWATVVVCNPDSDGRAIYGGHRGWSGRQHLPEYLRPDLEASIHRLDQALETFRNPH